MALKEHGTEGWNMVLPGDAERQMPIGEVTLAYYRRLVDATKANLASSPAMEQFHVLSEQELTFDHKRAIITQYVGAIVKARVDKGVQYALIGKGGRDPAELAAAEGAAKTTLQTEYTAADDRVALCVLQGRSPAFADSKAFMQFIEASKGPLPGPMKLK